MHTFGVGYIGRQISKPLLFLIDKIKEQTPTRKNILTVAGGAAGSQIITVAATPLLARIYGPESFGTLAVFSSALVTANVISSLRYELAITLPEEDKAAISLVKLIFCLLVLSFVISLIAISFFGSLLPVPEIARVAIYLLPLSIILTGLHQAFCFWLIRKKDFKLLSSIRIKQSLLGVLLSVVLSIFGPIGLIIGSTIGKCGGTLIILRRYSFLLPFPTTDHIKGTSGLSQIIGVDEKRFNRIGFFILEVKDILMRYKQYPMYSFPSGLIISVANELPTLLIANYYGLKVAGAIFMIRKILVTPTSLISSSVNQVLRGDAPLLFRQGKLSSRLSNAFRKLLISSCLVIVPLSIALYLLLPIFLGEAWSGDSLFAIALTPLVIGMATVSPLTVGFGAAEKLQEGLYAQVVRLVFQTLPLYISCTVLNSNPFVSVFILSCGTLLGYFGYFVYMIYVVNKASFDISRS